MRPGGALWLAAAALAGCAHVVPPEGGPVDREPPRLIATRPDTLAVVPGWRGSAVLLFDERVSERGVEAAVQIYPRTSSWEVSHRGDEIRASLRDGWRPNTIYQVTLTPPIQDLFGNQLKEPIQLVFSTGPQIPDTRAAGTVIDRVTGKPEVGTRVEAIRRADSLVYAVPTDSAGRFVLSHVPEGDYLIRAYRDQNRNRALDSYEPRDTALATIAVRDTAALALSVVMPDSTAPKIASVQLMATSAPPARPQPAPDSAAAPAPAAPPPAGPRIEVRFDDFLDPAQPLDPARVQVVDSAGAALGIARLAVGALPAADTARTPAVPAAPAGGAPAAARDTASGARPLPSQTLVLELARDATLVAGAEYRVRVQGIRNVVGLAGDSEGTLRVPGSPAAPAAPADTVRRPGGA